MTAAELGVALRSRPPQAGGGLYVERCGDDYRYRALAPNEAPPVPSEGAEAWLCYSGSPPKDPARFEAFFADLLAELDAMALPGDRCRWPLDEPWPHTF